MSRIGKAPVPVPSGVEVTLAGQTVTAKGKLGVQSVVLGGDVGIRRDGDVLVLEPRSDSQRARTMWGTSRSLVNNAIRGVAEGFSIRLEINGVGYRGALVGKNLVLQLGYSHEVVHPIPDGVTIVCAQPTQITVSGADRQLVGR